MRARDTDGHSEAEASRRTTAPAATRAPDLGGPEHTAMSPQGLLALQRTAGNATVARLIEEARHQHGADCGHQHNEPAPVQRSAVHGVLRTSGSPLEEPVRQEMEARLGADFSDVRLHTDSAARASAAEVGARAYTSGSHVVIGDGGADKHTLAHELTHVIQQRQGAVAGTDNGSGLKVSDPSDRFERAAEANATEVLRRPLPGTTNDRPEKNRTPASNTMTAHEGSATVQRAPISGAAPVLSASHLAADDLEGECGFFERRRKWNVNNPQQGLIIQQITRRFAVEKFEDDAWTPLQGGAIDSYITAKGSNAFATVTQYWELWQVDAQGNVADQGDDTFSLCSVIPGRKRKNTTRGSFAMTGDAVFYPTTVTPDQLGFARHAAAPAGGLFSTLTDPAAAISANGLVASGTPIRYRTNVTWDSSAEDRHSDVQES
ncbi:DUF4157 domain-containing protein [Streptomyces sp. NPDC005279]|uniref:eCIS core domain-containing protein n=1 Tax=Streptomyces sp. NPDC005279 TaxID=3364712 RepID=UPI0036983582